MRPPGIIPQWSTDVNYPAGPNPWNGQPTKIDPGLGQVAGGHVPNTFDPAQWENWFKNKASIFLKQHDAIEVQNWKDRITIKNSAPSDLLQISTGNRIDYDPVSGLLWVAGVGAAGPGSTTLCFSANGYDWTDDHANIPAAPPLYSNLAINPNDGYMYASGATKSTSRTPLGVYTHFVLPNGGAHGAEQGSVYDPYANKFVWWGRDTTPHPAIWSGFETFGSISQEILQNGTTYTGTSAAMLFAAGPNRKVAFYIETAPAGSQGLWDVDTYGHVWTDRGPVIFNGTCKALHYNDTTGLFMAIDNTGFTYVSADGINWTQQSDNSGLGWSFSLNGLSSYGSLWIAALTISGTPFLAWSRDDGATWNRIPTLTDLTKVIGSLKRIDDRIVAIDTEGNVSYSTRAK